MVTGEESNYQINLFSLEAKVIYLRIFTSCLVCQTDTVKTENKIKELKNVHY